MIVACCRNPILYVPVVYKVDNTFIGNIKFCKVLLPIRGLQPENIHGLTLEHQLLLRLHSSRCFAVPVPTFTMGNFTEVAEASPLNVPSFTHLTLSFPGAGVANLALNRPPVNALSLAVWQELNVALTYLESQFPLRVRVLIISSALNTSVFSAGNDLHELHVPSTTQARFTNFWQTLTRFLARLYATPLATIIALHGMAPAAPCAIALCVDYRLCAPDLRVGLNEVTLGLTIPQFWLKVASQLNIPQVALMRGTMLDAEHAREHGVVHEVVKGDAQDVLKEAIRYGTEWAKDETTYGRVGVKRALRKQLASEWMAGAKSETREAWKLLSRKETIDALGNVMKKISSRSKL